MTTNQVWWSYGNNFGPKADVVLPGDTEHIGQVEGEVDNSSTGSCQVSSGERRTEEETLHDGDHGVGAQEEEDHSRVAVGQQVPHLFRTTSVKQWKRLETDNETSLKVN